jgi:hypothetical protein
MTAGLRDGAHLLLLEASGIFRDERGPVLLETGAGEKNEKNNKQQRRILHPTAPLIFIAPLIWEQTLSMSKNNHAGVPVSQ